MHLLLDCLECGLKTCNDGEHGNYSRGTAFCQEFFQIFVQIKTILNGWALEEKEIWEAGRAWHALPLQGQRKKLMHEISHNKPCARAFAPNAARAR
jgi:hypothetical protein